MFANTKHSYPPYRFYGAHLLEDFCIYHPVRWLSLSQQTFNYIPDFPFQPSLRGWNARFSCHPLLCLRDARARFSATLDITKIYFRPRHLMNFYFVSVFSSFINRIYKTLNE